MENEKFIGMGNDYMFHAVLQESEVILQHLISTLMEIEMDEIKSCTIKNPIELGKSIDAKDCILDVKLLLNDYTIVNVELQMYFDSSWTERSLLYWSRAYDSIKSGDDYDELRPTYHIGILNYTLFIDAPEFYSEYMILNTKTHKPYTDKLSIRILDLTMVDSLDEINFTYNPKLIKWAKIFKAKSKAELKALTDNDEELKGMILTLSKLSENEKIREQCFAREDYDRRMRGMKKQGIELGKELERQANQIRLINSIIKKVQKGKDLATIADELELEENEITSYYKAAKDNPQMTAEEIYEHVKQAPNC